MDVSREREREKEINFCFVIINAIIMCCVFDFSDEYNRVKLNFMRGVDGSDYINASYIDVSFSSHFQLQALYTCLLTKNTNDLTTLMLYCPCDGEA